MHRYHAPALADLAYALAKWGEKQVNPRWLAAYFSRWQELLSTAHAHDKPGAGSAGSASSASNQAGQDAGGALHGVPDDQGSSAGALGMAGSQQRMVSNGEQRGEVMGGATWAGAQAAGLNARVVDQALWSWAELRWPVPHSVLHRMAFEVQVCMLQRLLLGTACKSTDVTVHAVHVDCCK